ncbi:MAG: VWA domain-containing protein, partial [Chloroflexi bacterium]|nr:VWA domain-containing protein [Chloroflexota bacterium]
SPTPAPAWQLGVIPRFRRMRSRRAAVDYEQFDYIAAVRRLESQIAAIVEGRDGRPGLAAILTMRRFGTLDPWRRPRRFRRGDTGEIDGDHPENLLVDPSIAFLRGLRRHRDEGQKDFANVILLDVSGSVVQRGYPSRKFDQVVDTMVVFCEVHERLKLPYQLMCFSETPTVLRSFAECRYESLYLDPTSAHVIKDFSELVRQMYLLEHTETLDASALRQALASAGAQRGLKTILVVTDGISSDRSELWSTLGEIETRNELVPVGERLQVLAFGVGLAEQEFRASYEPVVHGHRLRCSRGRPVRDFDLLPAIVCDVLEERIRTA